MCGRYQFSTADCPALRAILDALGRTDWHASEIFPTAAAPALIGRDGAIVPALLEWGFPWPGRNPVINARCETILVRPMFQDAVRNRRCAVPAAGFYEWDAARHKFLFQSPDRSPLYMAAVHEVRDGADRFCILTTEANESVAQVHGRMPLLLTREQLEPWIMEFDAAQQLLQAVPPPLSRSRADGQLGLW